MDDLTTRVLQQLEVAEFTTRPGDALPFGERLPLVTGMAWEKSTAQLVLIAQGNGVDDLPAWRQLLFAASGIRFQLSADDSSAFGTPVLLAIVNSEAEGRLRELAESLTEDFSVFTRIDLSFVREADVGKPDLLEDALAPLLPRCRRILGSEISRQEVLQFWELLGAEIAKAAAGLDPAFGEHRELAGRYCAEALIGMSAESAELPSPGPIGEIHLKRFRSIASLDLKMAAVNVIHGPNGSGKTSLVEALELAWAGTSARKPEGASVAEYAEALPQGGYGEFRICADGKPVEGPIDKPRVQLARCALSHEAISNLASQSPEQRFGALLEITGLEIPDLKARTEVLLKESKRELDRALSAAGLSNLPRSNSVGLKHYYEEISSDFAGLYEGLPRIPDLQGALSSVSRGRFRTSPGDSDPFLEQILRRADTAVSEVLREESTGALAAAVLDEARDAILEVVDKSAADLAAYQPLLGQLREQLRSQNASEKDPDRRDRGLEDDVPIGIELAQRWLRHSQSLVQTADQFRDDAGSVEDRRWKELLVAYANSLDQAAKVAPVDALVGLSRPVPPSERRQTFAPDIEVQRAAGFDDDPIEAEVVGPVLRQLTDGLQRQITGLRDLANRLDRHPIRNLNDHKEDLMRELCRFELARTLRREGPILKASERLVTQLLDERLAPVVRELVAAMVRFDWYFKPLRMSTGPRSIVLGGLATDREDLDARLLLNSAEQTVLGLAWFLALHMLQPRERREILVLDDPTAMLDDANIAGFASTLRAFARLLRPKQIVVATHDDQVAAMLAEELAVVDGWPESVLRVRFKRNASDVSEATEDWARDSERRIDIESERLGLVEEVGG
jgi:energy-coupling factor transporter ATP-binding protein EcfA2